MKLDEKQTKELEEIINFVQTAAHKLLVNMILMSLCIIIYKLSYRIERRLL